MKNLKHRLIVTGMAIVTGVAFFASTAGTLAWYAYATRVSLSFTGTSVRKSELIHVGLVDGSWVIDEEHPDGWDDPSTHKFTDREVFDYELTREVCGNNSIVWTTASTGFPTEAIKTFLSRSNYAYNLLSPVSTKSRALNVNTDIVLYQSPGYGITNVTELALTSQYVRLPFAFKSIGSDSKTIKNKKVWLTDAEVLADDKRINEAVRLFVDNGTDKYLVNPNIEENETGFTYVGGLLDLDGDGTYDYDISNNKEYVYGDRTGDPTYGQSGYVPPEPYLPDNVNNVDEDYVDEGLSTFYAKHKEGVLVANTSGVTYSRAEYETFGSIKPAVLSTGYFDEDSGRPITITSNTDGIGYATLTVFLEGWDHSIRNAAIGYKFSLGLTFEIDKL